MKYARDPIRTGWLWLTALVFIGLGYGAWYLLQQDPGDPEFEKKKLWTIMITAVSSGICIIAATAKLWMRR